MYTSIINDGLAFIEGFAPVSYTHLRAHAT